MKTPLSWLKDFVEIDLSIAELAHLITMAGMEVEGIQVIGLKLPLAGTVDAHVSGLEWDSDKIVVASVSEVLPHPNADRLVLCKLNDGVKEHVVLTGAPNLYEFKGKGTLPVPLKVAYAREGARIYDGHADGLVLTTLKPAKIRGVDSYSMICSEKELGISEEHEGILFLEAGIAPDGTPLADVLGDAVFDIKLLPSYARCASMLGMAREIAAMTGKTLKGLAAHCQASAPGKADFASIEISDPQLNPRFTLGLIRGVTMKASPAHVQRRLKMAGMRPINNIVDATNYVMLEIGQPLHAFDHDVLAKRAADQKGGIRILTRCARQGEKLTTLDGVERTLDASTVLVCDGSGALSIAGVMGGAESEVSEKTTSILLEAAAWNFVNIRKTARTLGLASEASYRFSRGVHPAMAERGLCRALELMQAWAGGKVVPGIVDAYPLPPEAPAIVLTQRDVQRVLGIELTLEEIRSMLERLEFRCQAGPEGSLIVTPPDHRLDIGTGVTGKADLVEEVARVYGYDRIPETRMADRLPLQLGNPQLDKEERVRDLLVTAGMQEIISYRFTTPEREARRLCQDSQRDDKPYVQIANPISPDKAVLRHTVLASVLEAAERNARVRERVALFEIGPAFLGSEDSDLPEEQHRLALVLAGTRSPAGWQAGDTAAMDLYDLKGILEVLCEGLNLPEVTFEPAEHPSFHPGKCARLLAGGTQVGVMGELHPQVRAAYDLPAAFRAPILAADLNLDLLLELTPGRHVTEAVPSVPPVLEDLAVVVDEALPAARVAALIAQTGGKIVSAVRLFDVYRGEKIGSGKKSLAYSLTYQARDKTLSDKDVAGIRTRIIRRLEQELGAVLRS